MKKTLLISFILFFVINVKANINYRIKFGAEENGFRNSRNIIVGSFNNNVITFNNYKKNSIITILDNNLTTTSEANLEFNQDKKTRLLEEVVLFNNRILIFTSYLNKKTKIKTLYYEVYNVKSLRKEKDTKELLSFSLPSKKNKNASADLIDIQFSEDEQLLGLIINLPNNKNESKKFTAIVLDKDFKEELKQEYTLPVPENKMNLDRAYLSNSGEFYVSTSEKPDDLTYFKPSSIITHIYQLTENGKLIDNIVQLNDKYIYSYSFKTNEFDDLILFGLYSLEERADIEGTFYLRMDAKTKEVDFESSEVFSQDFITQGWSEKSKKKIKEKNQTPKLSKYKVQHFISTNDGGELLISEHQYIVRNTYTGSQGETQTIINYLFGNIIISKLDKEGNFVWKRQINKSQSTSNFYNNYCSYIFHQDNEYIYFVYNDNLKNYDENGKAILDGSKLVSANLSNYDKKVASLVKIDINNGEVLKEKILGEKETNTIVQPKLHFSDKVENHLYFYTSNGKIDRICKVDLN